MVAAATLAAAATFSYPDYTVGPGVAPDLPPKRLAGFTADLE